MKYEIKDKDILYYISAKEFSLGDTLDCGQCFRFAKTPDDVFEGVHLNKHLRAKQEADYIIFYNTTKDDFLNIWCDFFDFNTDYSLIKKELEFDETIKKAMEFAGGIRILKQNSWEAICSFIISQNNNIPRIKGIISRFCEMFGEELCVNQMGEKVYTFPKAELIATKTVEDLSPLRAGFRAKYILDAAKKMSDGTIDINFLNTSDLLQAQKHLECICGVGPKVAQCALLFGFYKLDAFPIDVWIKKALDYFYKEGFPTRAQKYAGIAQQYIFHYIRMCEDALPKEYKK